MSLKTYPLDNVDYAAEDAELFHCTRSSGIYANDDFDYSVTGADNTITIGVGLGWIRNSKFSGKVVAQKAALALDMGLPDAVYPRIDAVVIQFDANKNGTEIVVKKGTAAAAPAPPAVSRTEALYELHLYHVRREPGAAAVTASGITDLRKDANYCGLMADSVTVINTIPTSHELDRNNPHKVTAAQVGAAPASHVNDKNNPHGVTAAQIGAATAFELTATISGASWALHESGAYYSIRDGLAVKSTDTPIIDLNLSAVNNLSSMTDINDAWGEMLKITTHDGYIVLYCESKPSVDIPIKIKVVR